MYIEYRLTGFSQESNSDTSFSQQDHTIIIDDFSPGGNYQLGVVIIREECLLKSAELSVFISDIDQDVQDLLPDFTIIEDNETPFQGHILTNKPFDPGAAVIIDNQAKIVWYYLTDDLISLVHWTTNRTILIVSNFGQKLTEVDLDGSIIFELEFGEAGFDKELHHEARLTPEGNIMALTLVSEVFDLTGIGGSSNQTVTGDGIVIFDRSGNKVWEWDVFQIKDPETDSSVLDNLQDWIHVNSLIQG